MCTTYIPTGDICVHLFMICCCLVPSLSSAAALPTFPSVSSLQTGNPAHRGHQSVLHMAKNNGWTNSELCLCAELLLTNCHCSIIENTQMTRFSLFFLPYQLPFSKHCFFTASPLSSIWWRILIFTLQTHMRVHTHTRTILLHSIWQRLINRRQPCFYINQ